MTRSVAAFALALLASLAPHAALRAADWPSWRGPDTRGVSDETGLPTEWTAEKGIAIAVELPEWGNSSPVIVGGRVYLTAQTEDSGLWVLARDAKDGAEVWSKRVGEGRKKAHELHNMASPTVFAEKDRVWALFGTGDLVALDRDGEELWRVDLEKEHGDYEILWGMASSPLVVGDRLFLVCMHSGPSYVLALDKATGKRVWKTERDLPCVGEAPDSYSTPTIARLGDRVELVVGGADHVNAYDLATGEQLWIASGLKIEHQYGRSIASPTFGEGFVVASSSNFGKLGRSIAIRAGQKGDVTEKRAWTHEKSSPDCPTPLVYDGHVYFIRDDGVGSCVALESGEDVWSKRIFRGDVKASPVAGDGKVYFTSMAGECAVLEAGAEGKELGRGQLGEGLIATPAISGGRLWFRSKSRLWAVGK